MIHNMYNVKCVTDAATTSQVGLMLHENTINNILEGGPADQCGQLERGDVIIAVDGEQVTAESAAEALIGSDIPSTWVVLTVLGSAKVRKGL
jgi:C-terminal processing protease CtpA/Prc